MSVPHVTVIGAGIIGEHEEPLLAQARIMALTHHERWDGTGYPEGLRGEAIPLGARIFAVAGLTDPRVTYWEPAKWVARLRATMTGGGPILLRINMGAGHGGASGRFSRLDEVAIVYAFALWAVGLAEAGLEDRPGR